MAHIRGVEIAEAVLRPEPTGWPAETDRPVLLFGGTFDPPHLAHVTLAVRAREALFGGDGVVVFVPAGRSPHKITGPVADPEHRVAMLELATADDHRAVVWTDEIDRASMGEPSFWVDTLARAASLLPETTPLRFLIGADQADAFDRWHEHKTILAIAEPAVLLREPAGSHEAFRRQLLMSGQDFEPWMERIVIDDVMPGVATDIRHRLSRGAIPGDAAGMLHDDVAAYIRERALYSG